jgi:hypothetical protein
MALGPLDNVILGNALNSFGFTGNQTISGIGLITFGFLWPCSAIWMPTDSALVTTWVPASVPVITTEVCVDDEGGLYG